MNHSINNLLWITLFVLLYVLNVNAAPSQNECEDVTCNPTSNPTKSPSKSPSTQQFTEFRTMIVNGDYTDFQQYCCIPLNDVGLAVIENTFSQAANDPDIQQALANLIITVINTFQASSGIEFSITGDRLGIDAADNTIQNAIDNSIGITVGPLTLTLLSVKSGLRPTITPSKSPTDDSESISGSSDYSDIQTANKIPDLSDQNNMKGNFKETDLTISISNKTWMVVWCILIGMLIMIALYAYWVNYVKSIEEKQTFDF